jgi:hypothetical protein
MVIAMGHGTGCDVQVQVGIGFGNCDATLRRCSVL